MIMNTPSNNTELRAVDFLLRQVREFLIDQVENNPGGIVATELAARVQTFVMENLDRASIKGFSVIDFIEREVESGSIVELEYITPSMSYRVKSRYYPAGTLFRIPAGHSFHSKHTFEGGLPKSSPKPFGGG